jgi:hypothetical protein
MGTSGTSVLNFRRAFVMHTLPSFVRLVLMLALRREEPRGEGSQEVGAGMEDEENKTRKRVAQEKGGQEDGKVKEGSEEGRREGRGEGVKTGGLGL